MEIELESFLYDLSALISVILLMFAIYCIKKKILKHIKKTGCH